MAGGVQNGESLSNRRFSVSGKSDNLLNRVGEVLCQSDLLKQWKQSMPEGEYKAKAKEHIIQTYEQASQIRKNILAERQRNQDIELER